MADEKKAIELTPEIKAEIHRIYNESPDLILITKKVFNDETLDGRSAQGRAVRKFLIEQGLKYRTTKIEAEKDVILTEHHKNFILQNCGNMTAFQMAKILFPDEEITTTLAKECRTIIDFVRENAPDKLKDSESGVGIAYTPPSTLTEAVIKINRSTAQEINVQKLSAQHKQSIQAFIRFINSPRLVQIVNSYADLTDRELFESEFTRFTWDKPDLTADDVALYIGVCQDIVENKRLVMHKDKLNKMFEDTEGNDDLTVRLADTIKAKSEEYDKVQKRIESVLKKLAGDRGQRLKQAGDRTASFLALVEAFQQEDERKRLLIIAKSQREKIKDEVNRLEGLDDYLARIAGISKQEIL